MTEFFGRKGVTIRADYCLSNLALVVAIEHHVVILVCVICLLKFHHVHCCSDISTISKR